MHRTAPQPPHRHWLISGSTPLTLAMTALSAIYLISAIQLAPPLDNGRLTASFFPLLVGVIALGLCLAQLIANYRASDAHDTQPSSDDTQETTPDGDEVSRARFTPAMRLIVATAFYIAAFSHLGYLLSSACYVLAVMLLFSGRQRWMSKAVIACVVTALGYGLFEQLFNVHLPTLELSAFGIGNGS